MKRKGTYKIIAEKSLIVQFYSGDVFMEDLIYLQKIISNELNYKPTFDIVADFSEANLILTEKDLNDYSEFIKNHPKIQGKRKAAYLTSKPQEVVMTTLFSELIKDTSIQPNIFSTTIAIVNWLNKEEVDNQFLSLVINELKTQPNTRS
ncbi:hypothetical protein ACFLT1_00555 [Bacteroidota bacterium]